MKKTIETQARKTRRHARIRAKISGTSTRPRLSIYRSTNAVYAQLIDDEKGITLASVDSRKSKAKTPQERAKDTGLLIAKAGSEKKIKKVVFDRGGYGYKGKIKVVAEGAREGGLEF